MLAKRAEDRPANGAAVAAAIEAIGLSPALENDVPHSGRVLVSRAEQRFVTVLIVSPASTSATASAPTVPDMMVAAAWESRLASRHQATLSQLADGSRVLVFGSSGAATDRALSAARAAMELRGARQDVALVIATGRASLTGRLPVGEALDRAGALLASARAGEVHVDSTTASLLGDRAELDGTLVLDLVSDAGASRTLLGRPTPCVGRERELAQLEAIIDECSSEPIARPVLVTAPAGTGKSRLRYELAARLAAKPEDARTIWLARCDATTAGFALGTLGQLVRAAAGIRGGEPIDARRDAILACASRYAVADPATMAGFLGELSGTRMGGDVERSVDAARADPLGFSDRLQTAFVDLVDGATRNGPLVLVLEDFHWGDTASARALDVALKKHHDRPLVVLALARPEISTVFPRLWEERGIISIRLLELTKKASEKLVRAVLDDVERPMLERIVERAGGNAFYLEELIRSVVEGRAGELPDSIIAMAEARLERLTPEERRVLRVASVFGEAFPSGGAIALLGSEGEASTREHLAALSARELVEPRGVGRFPGSEEYAFRHALLREAAYASLTNEDRILGHRLAANWLERNGEHEAALLAQHFERGNEIGRAITWYRRAAVQALSTLDVGSANAQAARAVELGATGAELGGLLLTQSQANFWRGDFRACERVAALALDALPMGSSRWITAAISAYVAATVFGRHEARAWVVDAALGYDPPSEWRASYLQGCANLVASHSVVLGESLARVISRMDTFDGADEVCSGWVAYAHASSAMFADDDPWSGRKLSLFAADRIQQSAALNAAYARWMAGEACVRLGADVEAEQLLMDGWSLCARNGLGPPLLSLTSASLSTIATRRGDHRRALEHLRGDIPHLPGNPSATDALVGRRLAFALAAAGRLEEALARAETANGYSGLSATVRASGLGVIATILLQMGRGPDALIASNAAMDLLREHGVPYDGEARVRLVHAEALEANGKRVEARRAIDEARARLIERADRIGDENYRRSFFERVEENARTLAFASSVEHRDREDT
jgi:hypothetical protein